MFLPGENQDMPKLFLQVQTTASDGPSKDIEKVEAFFTITKNPAPSDDEWVPLAPTTIIFSNFKIIDKYSGFRIAQMMKDSRRNPLAKLVPWTWTFPSSYIYREFTGRLEEKGYGNFHGTLEYNSKKYAYTNRKIFCSSMLTGTGHDTYWQPLYSNNSMYAYSANQNGKRPHVYWIEKLTKEAGIFESARDKSGKFINVRKNVECPINISDTPTAVPTVLAPDGGTSYTTTAPPPDNATTPDDDLCSAVALMPLKDTELREMKKGDK
jgi:hypothetical protein